MIASSFGKSTFHPCKHLSFHGLFVDQQEIETRLNREAKLQMIVPCPPGGQLFRSAARGGGRTFSLCDSKRRKSFYNDDRREGRFTTSPSLLFDSHSVVNETKSKIGGSNFSLVM